MLSIRLICVGKLREQFYVDAFAEYSKRLSAYCKFECIELNETKLGASPSDKEIAAALAEQFSLTIDGKKLVLEQPIKSFGSYEVKAKLGYEVSGTVYVLVIEEK